MKTETSPETAFPGTWPRDTDPRVGSGLLRELDTIHRALFGQPAPVDLISAYRRAHSIYPVLAETHEALASLIDRGIDLEAAEFAERRRDPANPLTQRFRTVAYLAEARSERLADFIGKRIPLPKAFAALAFAVLWSFWKLVKSSFQRKTRV